MMKKFIAWTCAALLAFATPALAANTPLGSAIDELAQPSPATPQSGDKIPVQRGGSLNGFYLPGNSYLIPGNNLSDVGSKSTSRTNLGLGPSVSIMDFGADPTGAGSSETAFSSCIATTKNCYIPTGTYQIGCLTHNATNGIVLYGDDLRSSTLKLPASCTFPTTGLINLANIQNLSIDVNNNTVGTASRVVSNFITGSTVNLTPSYQNIQVLNASTNMYLLNVAAQSTGNVIAIIKNNILRLGSPASASVNQCIYVTNGVNSVIGGQITGNVCVNSGMAVSASDVVIENNDISNWAYSAGIVLGQNGQSGTFNNHVLGNRLHDSGSAIDFTGSPTNGILNWGKNTEVSNNIVTNIGGACIDNGGQNSMFTNNYCLDAENRVDGFGDAAYFVFYVDSTFNGNGSAWIGNYAADDRGASAKVLVGYQDSTNNANIFLSGNVFSGIPTPYFLQ